MQTTYNETAESVNFKSLINDNYAAWNTLNAKEAAQFYALDAVFFDIIPPVEGL